MYSLKIKFGGENFSALKKNAFLYFIPEDESFTHNLRVITGRHNYSLTAIQEKSFVNGKNNDVRFYVSKPDEALIIVKKYKLNEDFSSDFFRNYLSAFLPTLENEETANLIIMTPDFKLFTPYLKDEQYFYQSICEGLIYGNYSFGYKSDKKAEKKLTVTLIGKSRFIKKAVEVSSFVMDGVILARRLANEPSSILTPVELARIAKKELSPLGVKCQIFTEKEIEKLKYGGILAVAKGSDNPPRLIKLSYNPAQSKKKIVLVGKGVTFDSGGISIKPASGMSEMKADMSGAAAVIGVIMAAAKAKLPIEVMGIIPAVENMPSGKSMKPGDIVFTSSGKSIEVDNTDAEGRIILADALEIASKEKPDAIIDIATLTGACVVALGEYIAGLFTKNQQLSDKLSIAGKNTYEIVWPMPVNDEFKKLIKSDVADVKNVGKRGGGAVSAAKFLEYFVDKNIPYAHIDIAGPAMPNDLTHYTQKYMTGFGVRLLFDYLLNASLE
ncbi:MAG: leucyl aminopeptidase [Ignavibacteria bacterium]